MTNADKELKSKVEDIEDYLQFLRNTIIDDPSANCHMSETRYKNTQKYIEKLLKNYREKQIKKGSVNKPTL